MCCRCWSNDILMSGWKQIGVQMWNEIGSKSTAVRCPFNSLEDELSFAKLCCIHQYPGCIQRNGTNVCKASKACRSAGDELMQARADLGFGICRFVSYDTKWRKPPDLPSC